MMHDTKVRLVKALERIGVAMRGPQAFSAGHGPHDLDVRTADALELIADAMEQDAARGVALAPTTPPDPIDQAREQISQVLASAPTSPAQQAAHAATPLVRAGSTSPLATNSGMTAVPTPQQASSSVVGFTAPAVQMPSRTNVADIGVIAPPNVGRPANGQS